MKQKLFGLVLVLVLSFSTLAGCSPAAATPTPPAGGDAEGAVVSPPDPAAARDAVLAYLVEAYGDLAPALDLTWTGRDATTEGLVGSSAFEYEAQDEAGPWIVAVSFPVVAPDQTIYRVLVANQDLPFQWQGDVDAGLSVLAAPPGVVQARLRALAYIAEHHGLAVPAPGTDWTEFRATPENIVGAETYEYRFEDWSITISYPVVAPENTIYDVAIVSGGGDGLWWEGKVTPQGEVEEVSMAQDEGPQGTPAVDSSPADADEVTELVAGNTAFALDLHQVLRRQEGNLFYSPYSLSLALAMTYAGARGETEAQMADAMHYTLAQARLHPAFAALSEALASRGEGAAGREGEGFRLNVANALWGQEGYPFLAEFLDLLDRAYGAGLRRVDYVGAPEEARQTINDWVANETEDRILDLIPEGIIDAFTRLVLTNAIYFNAAWAEPFEESMTREGPFYPLDGGQIPVPLMHGTSRFGYARGQGYQAVELPYDGYQLSMVILLPDAGEFEAFEAALDAPALETILDALAYEQVTLAMPRFEFDAKFRLEETLAALGMVDAFTDQADFSGMTGNRELFLSAVVHQAFVSVDEAGTEAAAATAVIASLTAAPAEPLQVTVDRPFLFLIRDLETGAVLFLGRVLDPSA